MSMFLSLLFFTTNVFAVTLSTPTVISDPAVQSGQTKVVSNTSGQAVAIWTTSDDDGNSSIAAAACAEDGTWTSPKTISTGGLPTVAINSNGHAIAIWADPSDNYQGTTPQIWGSFYNRISDTWSARVQLSTATTTVSAPQVVLDDSGNVFALWVQ